MEQGHIIKVEHPSPGVKVTYGSKTITVERSCPPEMWMDEPSSPSTSQGSGTQADLMLGSRRPTSDAIKVGRPAAL